MNRESVIILLELAKGRTLEQAEEKSGMIYFRWSDTKKRANHKYYGPLCSNGLAEQDKGIISITEWGRVRANNLSIKERKSLGYDS